MNGSISLNLSGHLLMSPGVSTALSAERGQGATFLLSCPCSLPCGWVGAGAALQHCPLWCLLSPLLRAQWGLVAFCETDRGA